ncbi:MAG: calycin-like domain-containing protein [Muribaculaceae bacterium]|nr:calycin-like domain-containing protein [Muribaculaceae bacterium]
MKKTLLMLAAVLCTLAASAASYTGKLTVKINDYVGSQDGVGVTIDTNADGTYRLVLKNFVLAQGEDMIPVGNIDIDSVPAINACGFTALSVVKDILISEGDLEGEDFWLGPTLENVPIKLTALFNTTEMRVHIDIDMTGSLGQMIAVDFETAGVDKPAGTGVRGDVNGDGMVDIDDVNGIINIMLHKE